MTAQFETLDQALGAAREPAAPAGLVSRIVDHAIAQPQQGRMNGLPPHRAARHRSRKRRIRRPALFGAIGGGLIAASAVAAALASDGRLDLAGLARPIMDLFGAPQAQTVTPPPPARQASASAPPVETPARDAGEATRPITAPVIDEMGRRALRLRRAMARLRMRQRRMIAQDGDRAALGRPALRRRASPQAVPALAVDRRAMGAARRARVLREAGQASTPREIVRASGGPAGENSGLAPRERLRQRIRDARRGTDRDRPAAAGPVSAASAQPPEAASGDRQAGRDGLIGDIRSPGPEPMDLPAPTAEPAAGDAAARPDAPQRVTPTAAQRRALQRRLQQQRLRRADRPRPSRNRPRIPRPRR